MHELQRSVQKDITQAIFSANLTADEKVAFFSDSIAKTDDLAPKHGIFLPHWSAEELPFFCKIEHDWAKNHNRIPVKFRLGSVDYVDWLEGKSWDKLRY